MMMFPAESSMLPGRRSLAPVTKKVVGVVIAAAVIIGFSAQAFAILTCGTACPPATATVQIGTADPINAPITINPNGTFSVTEFAATVPGVGTARIDFLSMDPDPVIFFGVGATNLTAAPLAFAFAFSTPVSQDYTLIDASASIGYTLSDGGAAGAAPSVTLTPFIVGGKVAISNDFFPPTNKGVDVGDAVSGGVAPCGAFAAGTSVCGPFAATNTFIQPAPNQFTLMATVVSFVLSGPDAAGLSGRVEQHNAIPEPATILLLGAGLAGFAAWRRYRVSR